MILRDVVIAGVYASQQARLIEDRTPMQLAIEVIRGALDDAGMAMDEVDGIAVDWPGPGGAPGDFGSWARYFGGSLNWIGESLFSTAGVRGLAQAAAAIATGQCDTIVMGGGMAGTEARKRFATVSAGSAREFFDCWGAYVAPAFALIAQRHMHEFGTRPEHLAEVAATIRNNGSLNPEAVMFGKGPYSIEDVLSSPMISTPFHLLDICLVAQGGAGMVLTSRERARDLPGKSVSILGIAQEIHDGIYVHPPVYRADGRLGKNALERAFGMAGLAPADVDVFCLYDPNSFEIIRQLELLGLCSEGEGGPFVAEGSIRRDGPHPVNPEGGCLSYSWNGVQQMTLKIVECVRQLRGDAGNRQIQGASIALATVGGPGAHKFEAGVFGLA